MDGPTSYRAISTEANNLSPDDFVCLVEHLARLSEVYQANSQDEKLNLEDLALSSLKIECIDRSISQLQITIRREAILDWDARTLAAIATDQKQFTGPRSQPRHATVRTSQLASEIAARWQNFAEYVSKSKKHLIPLDEIITLLDHEGLSHRLESMDSRALWLASRFLAHNPRKEDFLGLWLKIHNIRDSATIVERFNDLISAMPDQALADQELLDHALACVGFWQSQARALEADTDTEKQAFCDSFQGTRQTREHLRFQLTCRRQEVAQNTRLRRVMERMNKASQAKAERASSRAFRKSSHIPQWMSGTLQAMSEVAAFHGELARNIDSLRADEELLRRIEAGEFECDNVRFDDQIVDTESGID